MINGQCVGCPDGATSSGGTGGFEICRCPANYYMKNGQCVGCPTNSISPPGSTDISQCRCFANFYMKDGECKGCPEGATNPNEGSTSVYDCSCNSYTKYMDVNANKCIPCSGTFLTPEYPTRYDYPYRSDGIRGRILTAYAKITDIPNASSANQCHGCPPGQYIDFTRNPPICRGCPNGYYCPGEAAASSIMSCYDMTPTHEYNSGIWGGSPSEVTGRTKVSDCW
jgi:hypothetical protein